ncbi:titin-like [Leguminivora glycinivorella]|uniref:titin-like n=1 Tax=Leguminivora glycinivorella TaxID=1035111 RepID=UPI0020108813|nr:titin-like [Leguminivora glycinivorella]XP_047990993.1 titin-like [Leguminivora glycinivorella]
MNDISVKIVDFGKEQTGVDIVAPVDTVPENEVDPLAIDDSKVKEEAEAIETAEALLVPEKPEVEKTVESCDQNAKDENLSVKQNLGSEELKLQTQQIKEDLLKEDTISLASTTEDPTEEPETLQNGAELEAMQSDPEPIAALGENVEPTPEEAIEVPEITETSVQIPETPVSEPVVSEAPAPVLPTVVAPVVPTAPVAPSVLLQPTVSTIPPTPVVLPPSVSIVPSFPTQAVPVVPSVSLTPTYPSQSVPVVPSASVAPTPQNYPTPAVPVTIIPAIPIVPAVPTIPVPPSLPAILTVPLTSAISITPVAALTPSTPKPFPVSTNLPVTPTPSPVPVILSIPEPQKEPSPPKEVPVTVKEEEVKLLERIVEKVVEADVEMIEAPIKVKTEEKAAKQAVNGDVAKEEQATKRRSSEETETESPLKKLCQEVEKTFPQHDTMINDYIQTATKNNIDEIQRHTEQLLSEIQTLRELAQKKEHEWNNILHLKKVKEEILLRLLRRKQVLSFEKAADVNGSDRTDPFDYLNQAKNLAIDKSDEISGLSLKPPCSTMNPMIQPPVMPVTTHFNPMVGLPPPYDKAAHMQNMPKPVFPQPLMLPGPTMPGFPRDMNGQLPTGFGMPMGRQGPTKDVKSIIADYRQRNPDITPRRGRRMKSILNPNMMNNPRAIAPKIMENMNNYNNLNNLNMLFNNLDMNQKAMLERLQQIQAGALPNGVSFKDVLVQFANMQQTPGMPGMPRPPETVTNRPEHVPTRPERRQQPRERHEETIQNKQAERMASGSPRLPPPPPYPEISLLPVTTSQDTPPTQNSLLHGILTKNCGEITITPVQPTPPPADAPDKEEVVQLDDSESPASEGSAAASPADGGRLVIDEGAGAGAGDDAPPCQGCRRRAAQFVCAGCANQWYCSRDCQVAAWDDHSEMCSG